jgi:hypothetical protein
MRFTLTFSYWCFYVNEITRLECNFWDFIKYLRNGIKCEIAIHRYNKKYSNRVGKAVWIKKFND